MPISKTTSPHDPGRLLGPALWPIRLWGLAARHPPPEIDWQLRAVRAAATATWWTVAVAGNFLDDYLACQNGISCHLTNHLPLARTHGDRKCSSRAILRRPILPRRDWVELGICLGGPEMRMGGDGATFHPPIGGASSASARRSVVFTESAAPRTAPSIGVEAMPWAPLMHD